MNKIPLWFYCVITAAFFGTSLLGNMAFSYGIIQPVHMVFRSGSLVMSFLLGKLFFGHAYSLGKFISILCVTLGVVVALLAESRQQILNSAKSLQAAGTRLTSSASFHFRFVCHLEFRNPIANYLSLFGLCSWPFAIL